MKFSSERWPMIQNQMSTGQISEREALQKAFENFPISPQEACEWVQNHIEPDVSFEDFTRWALEAGHQVVVLSGGFVEWIEALFESWGWPRLPIHANSVDLTRSDWHIQEKRGPRLCEIYSHCKCASFLRQKSTSLESVYVGDGLTDACVAQKVDMVFAKSWLAEHLKQQNKVFFEFESFSEIRAQLESQTRVASASALLSSKQMPIAQAQLDLLR